MAVENGVHVGGSVHDFGVPESPVVGLWGFQKGPQLSPFQFVLFPYKNTASHRATATFLKKVSVVAMGSNIILKSLT